MLNLLQEMLPAPNSNQLLMTMPMEMSNNNSSQGRQMEQVTPNRTQTTTTMMEEMVEPTMVVISLLSTERPPSNESFIHYQLRSNAYKLRCLYKLLSLTLTLSPYFEQSFINQGCHLDSRLTQRGVSLLRENLQVEYLSDDIMFDV